MTKIKLPQGTKTVLWNLGYLLALTAVNYLLANLTSLNIPVEYVAIVSIILSGVSKYLATKDLTAKK